MVSIKPILSIGVDGSCGPATVTWKSYADNCYHISDQKCGFDEAKTECESLGATLTSIPGEVEKSFILDG